MIIEYPVGDTEFEEGTVVEVNPEGSFKMSTGFSLGFPKEFEPTPQVGDIYRTYGSGLGCIVRGLFFNGKEVFYRTEEEQDQKNKRDAEEHERIQREAFETNRAEFDRRFNALPVIFQKRIRRFRHNNEDFRWKFEGYEMFVCEEAVRFAEHFKTEDALVNFISLPYDEQQTLFAFDPSHSGNTFSAAVSLARLYVTTPEKIELVHGALAPLVGSKEYGCVPKDES